MPSTTRLFGLILIVLGIASYTMTGRTSVTAMIPAFFGAAFLVCAMVARKEAARKHAMHAAVALGLIGALAPGGRAVLAGSSTAITRRLALPHPPGLPGLKASRTKHRGTSFLEVARPA